MAAFVWRGTLLHLISALGNKHCSEMQAAAKRSSGLADPLHLLDIGMFMSFYAALWGFLPVFP